MSRTIWKGMKNSAMKCLIFLQSRPIQMRGTILYHANRWMDFKMLSTPNRFLDLLRVLLLPFCWIPQLIAQFLSICPLLCTPLSILLIIIQMRAVARQQERKKRRMGEKSFPSYSRVAWKISEILKVSENVDLGLQVIE